VGAAAVNIKGKRDISVEHDGATTWGPTPLGSGKAIEAWLCLLVPAFAHKVNEKTVGEPVVARNPLTIVARVVTQGTAKHVSTHEGGSLSLSEVQSGCEHSGDCR